MCTYVYTRTYVCAHGTDTKVILAHQPHLLHTYLYVYVGIYSYTYMHQYFMYTQRCLVVSLDTILCSDTTSVTRHNSQDNTCHLTQFARQYVSLDTIRKTIRVARHNSQDNKIVLLTCELCRVTLIVLRIVSSDTCCVATHNCLENNFFFFCV